MKRLQIPLHHLRAFVATARHLSRSKAADELFLTQGAVSKQVLELERTLEVPLFERVRKRLVLAPAGQRYLARVEPLLRSLDAATLEVMARGDSGGALHLSTLPTFGARWLIPRLPSFIATHPDVTLNFVPFVQGYDFLRPELDCAIRYGDGIWPGAQAQYLNGRDVVVIAPPTLGADKAIGKPQDVAQHVLLQHSTVPMAWADWCEAHGVKVANPVAGPSLDQFNSLISAVSAGLGLALVPRCLVQREVLLGTVRTPLDPQLLRPFQTRAGYHFCYPEAKAQMPALREFKEWITSEASKADA